MQGTDATYIVLPSVDLNSGCVFLAQTALDRSAGRWKVALGEKKMQGLKQELNVSDGGSGLVKEIRLLSSFCWSACSDDMRCCRNVAISIGVAMISGSQQLILERTKK